jgi:hypothetical protein
MDVPARVPDVDYELLLGGSTISQRLQPHRQLTRSASGNDHEAAAENLARELHPDHALAVGTGHKSLHRCAVDQRDVREPEHASPKVTLNVRAACEDIRGGSRVAGHLVPRRHEPDLLHRVATHRATGDELRLEARQELFDGGKSPRQQGVHVSSLRYRLAAQSSRWQDLALEDCDPIEVVRDCACSKQAGDAGADHHGVVCVICHGVSITRTRPRLRR